MKTEYSFEDLRVLLTWAFVFGVAVGLIFSLIWRASQIKAVEQFNATSNLTETYSDNYKPHNQER